jgi:hypothetical protein
MFREALGMDRSAVEIKAEDLHARVGEYPGPNQRICLCCDVMRSVFAPKSGDVLLKDTEPGREAELTIRYVLPRPEWGKWR